MSELSKADLRDFKALDAVVRRGVQTFVEVGLALAEIRDRELWRATSTSFADYVEAYEIKKSHAYRLIDAAKTAISVSPIGENQPANEAQSRELAKAGDNAPKAWERAQAKAAESGVPITAAVVRDAVAEVTSDPFDDGAEYEDDDYQPLESPLTPPGDDDRLATERARAIKTAEAMMRCVDDMHEIKPCRDHAGAIGACKRLIQIVRAWK